MTTNTTPGPRGALFNYFSVVFLLSFGMRAGKERSRADEQQEPAEKRERSSESAKTPKPNQRRPHTKKYLFACLRSVSLPPGGAPCVGACRERSEQTNQDSFSFLSLLLFCSFVALCLLLLGFSTARQSSTRFPFSYQTGSRSSG